MATTIRVLPQPGSIGAQRNQIAKKNQQITQLRAQVTQLRQQLSLLRLGAPAYGASSAYLPPSQQFPSYPTAYAQPTQVSQIPSWSGFGQLLGGALSGVASLDGTGYNQHSWRSPLQVGPSTTGWW